jgi:hypothetical protein
MENNIDTIFDNMGVVEVIVSTVLTLIISVSLVRVGVSFFMKSWHSKD